MLEDATRRDQIDLQLLHRYHVHQDLEAREEMVRRGLPLVRALARQYAGRGDALEDLVQVGTIGLIKAIDRFDPEAGSRFAAFASPNITGRSSGTSATTAGRSTSRGRCRSSTRRSPGRASACPP